MNLRKMIIGIAIAAVATFAGFSFQQTSASDIVAGPGSWITDTDVG